MSPGHCLRPVPKHFTVLSMKWLRTVLSGGMGLNRAMIFYGKPLLKMTFRQGVLIFLLRKYSYRMEQSVIPVISRNCSQLMPGLQFQTLFILSTSIPMSWQAGQAILPMGGTRGLSTLIQPKRTIMFLTFLKKMSILFIFASPTIQLDPPLPGNS